MAVVPEGGDCEKEDQLVSSALQTRDATDLKKREEGLEQPYIQMMPPNSMSK